MKNIELMDQIDFIQQTLDSIVNQLKHSFKKDFFYFIDNNCNEYIAIHTKLEIDVLINLFNFISHSGLFLNRFCHRKTTKMKNGKFNHCFVYKPDDFLF